MSITRPPGAGLFQSALNRSIGFWAYLHSGGLPSCYASYAGQGLSELIDRGPVKLRYFTVARGDFQNLHPQTPDRYSLVTQIFTADDEYMCTQLLGIDLRAVKYFARQGCQHLTDTKLPIVDRDRVQACLDAYARWIVNKVASSRF